MLSSVIFIQARLGSSRLPRKMLAYLNGISVIEWVIRRLKKSKRSNKIILLTSDLPQDEVLCKIAIKNKVSFYRGKEKDVLDRFYQASKKYKSNTIVRVCADNPFIDANEVDRLILNFDDKNFDYAFNNLSKGIDNHPDGFGAEIFTKKTLKKINFLAKNYSQREHVTKYIWDTQKEFKIQRIKPNDEISYPELRFDIDSKKDLDFFENFIKKNNIKTSTTSKAIIKKYFDNEFQHYLEELFPICRSITGDGNRLTLKVLKKIVPIKNKFIKSGKTVFDWKIPDEWNITEAHISDEKGKRLIDFFESNLHVMSYSVPVNKTINWQNLKDHIIYDPKNPNGIPYRTSYYKKNWAFCVTKKQYQKIKSKGGNYKVIIESNFKKGRLDYGEILIPGLSKEEILISSYICHPSMANDSLSGVLITAFLAKHIANLSNRKWSYRIIFVPETIGAIGYSFINKSKMKKINFGLNITTAGGKGKFGLKKSWQEDHFINRYIEDIFKESKIDYTPYPFDIHGSDERQYSTQGFGINVASITKDKYYEYKEYHSSLDNLSFVNGVQLSETFTLYKKLISKIEKRERFQNVIRYGEPMLSKHNLYPKIGGALKFSSTDKKYDEISLILWVMFLSNGINSKDDIAHKLGISIELINQIINKLEEKKLLVNVI